MNTNSKHYEELNIQPWEIMERNFNTEEFVAYLKGNIIKYTLRDKGQALTDAQKFKHYAEKLIEVLESVEEPEDKPIIVKDSKFKVGDRVRLLAYLRGKTGTIIRQPVLGLRAVDGENYIVELDKEEGWKANKREHFVDCEHAWYVDDTEIELLQEYKDKHKFNVGDRVVLYKDKPRERTGTVVRVPTEGYDFEDSYIINLDKQSIGWRATMKKDGVSCSQAWGAKEKYIELLETEPKKTLKPNKWYHTTDFTKEELEELLPVGTKVETEDCVIYDGIDTTAPTETSGTEVKGITQGNCDGRTFISTDSIFKREWFKIVEE